MYPLGWLARKIQGSGTASFAKSRAIAWIGAATTLAGLAWAISQILSTASQHPMALPLGVPSAAGLPFWVALIGFGLTGFALYRGATSPAFGPRHIGTSIGLVLTSLASLGILGFLWGLGLGPF